MEFRGHRLLVLDADPIARRLLAAHLSAKGADVLEGASLSQAHAADGAVEVAIVSLPPVLAQWPAVFAGIRARWPAAMLIATSVVPPEQVPERYREQAIFLSKPAPPGELVAHLREWFRKLA